MYNFQRDPYAFNQNQQNYGYEYDDDEEFEEEEEDEDLYNNKGEPLWAAKAEKPQGVGLGLGKGKTFSAGIGFSKTSQEQAIIYQKQQIMNQTGGSFYSQQKQSGSIQSKTTQNFYDNSQPKAVNSISNDNQKKKGKDIAPKRFALKYDPPTIIMEYLIPQTGKLYHHKMKLIKLEPDSSSQDAVEYLKKKHALYFLSGVITDEQLKDLVDKLKQKLKLQKENKQKQLVGGSNNQNGNKTNQIKGAGANTTASTSLYKKPDPYAQIGAGSNNKILGQASVQNNSMKQNISTKNQVGGGGAKKGQYDEEEFNFEDDEYNPPPKSNNFGGKKGPASKVENKKQYSFQPEEDEEEDEEEDDYQFQQIDYENYDLNKLTTEELQKHKQMMDKKYAKNFLKPGDPGYVYDKQLEFNPQESNEWDMDMDDDADIV